MGDGVLLVCSRETDLHIEFSPSFLGDPERRILDRCYRISLDSYPSSIASRNQT